VKPSKIGETTVVAFVMDGPFWSNIV
jgi:hypothetical protein